MESWRIFYIRHYTNLQQEKNAAIPYRAFLQASFVNSWITNPSIYDWLKGLGELECRSLESRDSVFMHIFLLKSFSKMLIHGSNRYDGPLVPFSPIHEYLCVIWCDPYIRILASSVFNEAQTTKRHPTWRESQIWREREHKKCSFFENKINHLLFVVVKRESQTYRYTWPLTGILLRHTNSMSISDIQQEKSKISGPKKIKEAIPFVIVIYLLLQMRAKNCVPLCENWNGFFIWRNTEYIYIYVCFFFQWFC